VTLSARHKFNIDNRQQNNKHKQQTTSNKQHTDLLYLILQVL
jgi:hypothetical protein